MRRRVEALNVGVDVSGHFTLYTPGLRGPAFGRCTRRTQQSHMSSDGRDGEPPPDDGHPSRGTGADPALVRRLADEIMRALEAEDEVEVRIGEFLLRVDRV